MSKNHQNPTKNVDLQAILRWLSESTLYFSYAWFIIDTLRTYTATRGAIGTVTKGVLNITLDNHIVDQQHMHHPTTVY